MVFPMETGSNKSGCSSVSASYCSSFFVVDGVLIIYIYFGDYVNIFQWKILSMCKCKCHTFYLDNADISQVDKRTFKFTPEVAQVP